MAPAQYKNIVDRAFAQRLREIYRAWEAEGRDEALLAALRQSGLLCGVALTAPRQFIPVC